MRLEEWLGATEGRTKADLARQVGVQWRAIHRIARGERTPSLSTAIAIERATGGEVTVTELLKPRTPAAADQPPAEVNSDHAAE